MDDRLEKICTDTESKRIFSKIICSCLNKSLHCSLNKNSNCNLTQNIFCITTDQVPTVSLFVNLPFLKQKMFPKCKNVTLATCQRFDMFNRLNEHAALYFQALHCVSLWSVDPAIKMFCSVGCTLSMKEREGKV